jgi:CheY-like chemotaxis protein
MSPSPQPILLVEDNDDEVLLIRRALAKAGLELPIHVAVDGLQAMDYLGGVGPYEDRQRHPMPAFVLLDLKLPYVHGFEVLAWIRRQDSPLRDLVVIIMTSSPEERDRRRSTELGARAYLVKPPTPNMITRALGIAPVA